MSNTRSNTSGVTTFKSQPVITSAILANTDSSTNIATTAWSNAFWTYVKTLSNTWSGTQTFSVQPVITSTILANTDSSTNIATTAWSNAFWTYVKTLSNTFSGATTTINSDTTNIGTQNLTGAGRVNIATGTNLDGSQLYLGSSTLYQSYIRAKLLSINDIGNTTTYIGTGGLSGSDRVFIASGANAVGSQFYLGSASLYESFIRGTNINIADNGGTVNIANGGLASGTKVNIVTSGLSNVAIGNSGNITSIKSNDVDIGDYITGAGVISIGAYANTTTGYIGIGSRNLDAIYIKAKTGHFNHDGGNTVIGNSTGITTILGTTNIGTGGLSAGARINIASGTNATDTEIMLGSTTLTKCFIRANNVNINHTTGGSIYMGADTSGTTNILGTVYIGTLSTNTGSTTIGNNSAPGYTEIASKGITLGRFMNASGYIDVAAQATGGYMILGSANMTTNYLRGETIYINDTGTGTTNIGNPAGGNIYLNRPLTIGYAPTANNLGSLSSIGGIWTSAMATNTLGTTYAIYSPLNGLPNGRYLIQAYIFSHPTPVTEQSVQLGWSPNAFSNAQTSGFNLEFANEIWGQTSATSRMSLSGCFVFSVTGTNNNLGLACRSGATLNADSLFQMKAIRIG